MSDHNQIMTEIENQYVKLRGATLASPGALAFRVFHVFSNGDESNEILYASIEHLKHLSRKYLAKKHDADADNSIAYQQNELDLGERFSGKLQDRYPLPRKRGDDAAYKLRSMLTPEERAWNVEQLRKSAGARMEHARALEAEGLDIKKSA